MSCDCNNNLVSIFKDDDTGAFKRNEDAPFIRINRPNGIANDIGIYKAEFKCGNLPLMTFGDGSTELTFPIDIELEAAETKKLDNTNICYLRVYDENGLRKTCNGTISFVAKNEVI